MIDFINKSVWVMMNPVSVGILLIVLGLLLRRFRKAQVVCLALACVWFYLWSTKLVTCWIGRPLESAYLVDGKMADAESYPTADAILDFGGGVGSYPDFSNYAELYQSADRAYFAAALWKAGKAPIIIPSSGNAINCDAKFLKDLGVPASAIVVENEAKNTEENAKRIVRMFDCSSNRITRVLLVTSAWHMKRSLLMMKKYASQLEVIPAPCDCEATGSTFSGFELTWLKPEPGSFYANSVYFHEWLGYWGYKLLR